MKRKSLKTILSCVLAAAMTLSSSNLSVMAQNMPEEESEELMDQEPELDSEELMDQEPELDSEELDEIVDSAEDSEVKLSSFEFDDDGNLVVDGDAVLLTNLYDPQTFQGFAGGDGSSESPYEISNVEQLAAMVAGYYVDNEFCYFILKNNIDLEGYVWDNTAGCFGFDGGGNTISNIRHVTHLFNDSANVANLTIKNFSDSSPLLHAYVGNIYNVTIDGIFTEEEDSSGTWAVFADSNYGEILKCTIRGEISTSSSGFCGFVGTNNGLIRECANVADKISTASNDAVSSAGIVCYNNSVVAYCEMHASYKSSISDIKFGGIAYENGKKGIIDHCSTSSKAEFSADQVGGIVVYSYGAVKDCTNNANIEAGTAGGIVCHGTTYPEEDDYETENTGTGSIENCLNTGTVHALHGNASGIACSIYSNGDDVSFKVLDCINKGELTSEAKYAAGIVADGCNMDIDNCTNIGNITADSQCGGILADGSNNIRISDCINSGNIKGRLHVGGIVGWTDSSTITRAANLGALEGGKTSSVGGVLGSAGNGTSITESFSVASITVENSTSGNVGGLAGSLFETFSVFNCFASTEGTVGGNGNSGGLFGGIYGAGTGDESAFDQKVAHCYSVCGLEAASTTHGGFAGDVKDSFIEDGINDCYILSNGDHVFGNSSKTGGVTKASNSNMEKIDTFAGFDFDNTWEMGTNTYKYPVLRWYPDVEADIDPEHEEDVISKPDVWGFSNQIEYFGEEKNEYMISEQDLRKALTAADDTSVMWLIHHGARTTVKEKEDDYKWYGSCEGMSRTVCLVNNGVHEPEQYGLSGVTKLEDVATADPSFAETGIDGVGIPESAISFYQIQQYLPRTLLEYKSMLLNKNAQYNAIRQVGEDLKSNPWKLGIISFLHNVSPKGDAAGYSGHTMVAYGYKDLPAGASPNFGENASEFKHGNDDYSQYTHCIYVYDPTNGDLMDDGEHSVANVYYDDSGNWIIPAYISSDDADFWSAFGCGYGLKIATTNPAIINSIDYVTGKYAFPISLVDISNPIFAISANITRVAVKQTEWCEINEGYLTGNYDGFTMLGSNDGDGSNGRNIVALPDATTYYIKSGEDGLDAMLYMGNQLVELQSDVIGDATVETCGAGSIVLSEEGTAAISLTANDGHRALDEPTVYVTAAGVKELSARQVENGVQIEGDNLSEVSIVATEIFEAGKEINIDTQAHAVQITRQGDKLEALADEDGDGVFETKCGEESIHITKLKLTEDELLLTPGESHTLVPVTSVEGNKDVEFTWISEDQEIATVDENGVIKAVSMGTTKITVKAGELTASCLVDVEKPISRNGETGIPDGMWVSCRNLEDLTYSGTAIKPEVRVYDSRTLLRKNADYTVRYKNNTKAYELAETDAGFAASKAPCITITGKGNYGSKETVYFTIQRQSIEGEGFAAYDMSLASTGKSQKVSPVLYRSGKALKNGTDYKVDVFKKEDAERKASLGNSVKDPGEYVVRLTGAGNFKDYREVDLLVSDKLKPVSKLSVGKIANVQYTGKAITPEPAIKDGKTPLENNTNYTLSYESNIAVGTAAVIITGKPEGGYSGTKRVTFKITGISISKAVVEGIPKSAIYSGKEISFDEEISIYIKAGKNTQRVDLKKTDYKVTYENNVNAGKATVIIQGQNDYGYTGTTKKTFKIAPYNIKPASDTTDRFKVSCPDAEYCKGGAKPKVTVQFKKADGSFADLKEGVDFKVTYKNNAAVSGSKKPTVTVTGKGNFTGSESSEFTIAQKELSRVTVNAADKMYKEKANIYSTTVTLVDTDGKKLKAGTDYEKKFEYTYRYATKVKNGGEEKLRSAGEAVDAGDIIPSNTFITVTASAKKGSNYKGKGTGYFRITRASISSANVKGIGAQTYTGKEITFKPENITVKVQGAVLKAYDEKTKEGDFIIKGYTNNINKGTATVTIEGVGDYFGTKTVSFKIKAKGFFWWWRS